jgi:hypothetical protein
MTMTMYLALAMMMSGGLATAQTKTIGPIPPVTEIQLQASLSSPVVTDVKLQTKVTANVSYQVKDDLFAGAEKFAQGASQVTEINLDPSTMGMLGGGHGRDSDAAKRLNFMVIHSYKYDKPGMYNMDDFIAYTKKLTDGSWNCSIHERSKSSSTDICSRSGADHETNEMVILTAEPRELTFIHMSGKMSLGDLNRMSGERHDLDLPRLPPEPRAPTPPVPPTPPAPPR